MTDENIKWSEEVLYDNDYEEAKALIDQIMGYFQFKSEVPQIGIRKLMRLRYIVKKNMKGK